MSSVKKNILQFKIDDINSFKTIIETLSKIVSETTFIIHNPKDKKNKFTGLEINTADTTRTVFVKIQIEYNKFIEFNCKSEKYNLGINLEKMNKMIKYVEKEDILNVYLNENDLLHLIIEIQRATTKGKKILKLPLIELDYEEKQTKKIDFDKIISMGPNIYKKIFRDLDDFQNIKIICSNKKIIFNYKDDTGTEIDDENILGIDGINMENTSTQDNFIGVYPLKFLILCVKCASLCEDIQIYMKNKNSLTIKYETISFGTILISLSPINEDCIKNIDYDYSDDEDEIDIISNNVNKLKFDNEYEYEDDD